VGRGTHSGPFVTPAGTIPATGGSIELRFAELFEVSEGKIRQMHAYYDTATMMRQLGLLPPAGGKRERTMTALVALRVRAKRGVKRKR
jgi:SnoaL-like polyketide cyclase